MSKQTKASESVVGSAKDLIPADFGEFDLLTEQDVARELGDPNGEFAAAKFLKLQPGEAVRGVFRGWLLAEVAAPGTGELRPMNMLILEPKPRIFVKMLGSSQIMQQLVLAKPGDEVMIARSSSPDIEIAGGRRVKQYLVAIKGAGASLGASVSPTPYAVRSLTSGTEVKKLGA